MHLIPRLATALLALALAAPAFAAEEGSVAAPRHTCKKPEYPGRLASDTQKRNFRKDVDTYADCIKRYVAVQQKNAESFVKAGNTAIDEYNAAVKEFQEQSK